MRAIPVLWQRQVIKAMSIIDEIVMRSAELIKWYRLGDYQQILDSVKLHECVTGYRRTVRCVRIVGC